jgi:emp24/gp25L/p24 family/GOLD
MSVFVLSGSQLKASVSLEGPLADLSVDTGAELHGKIIEFTSGQKPKELIDFSEVVDFEHLNEAIPNDDTPPTMEDDELKQPISPDDPDADAKRRERREKQRKKFLEQKQKREQRKLAQVQKVRQDGEPFVHTVKAPVAGWYRACVHSTWNQVVVEMEMRKESDLGGLDENGHVKSYEEQRMTEEDKELEEDTASEEGIKDEDFEETREKVKDLRRLLNEIQSMQQKERRRLTVHAETNEHSHSRMVLSSLMETLLFMAVTGYQVYTIRKWFSGAPVLGR